MYNLEDIIQQIFIEGTASALSEKIIPLLQQVGFSNEDIKRFSNYDLKLSFLIALDYYLSSKNLPQELRNALCCITRKVPDVDLQCKMFNFLNNINPQDGYYLYLEIRDSLPQDIVKDLYAKLQEVITNLLQS